MGLTAEQREVRQTGLGASEIGAVVEIHPYRAPIDVWLAKATPSRGPLVDDAGDSAASEVGSVLEDGIRILYERRTNRALARPGPITLRHPDFEHVLASPDDLLAEEDAGLEIKVVGERMAHHWAEDEIPDYVMTQVVQCMAVTDRSRWDVAALIGGTDLRIMSVYRDEELEATLLDAAEEFWECYIIGDAPPPVRDPGERRRYLRARYPGSVKTACRMVDDEHTASLIRALAEAREAKRRTEAAVKAAENSLCGILGDDYGIQGPWGKFIWPRKRGQVSWKEVALELAGGKVSQAVLEKHRGAPSRVPMFYGAKEDSSGDD